MKNKIIHMYKIKLKKLYSFFFFIFANILVTPMFFLLKFKGAVASLFIIIITIFYAIKSDKKLNSKKILFLLFFFVTVSIPALHFSNINYYFMFNTYIASIFFIDFFQSDIIDDFLEFQTNFFIFISILCIIGFIYAYFGGNPIFEIHNPDGRLNKFYLCTFSNMYRGRFIRPSGIYDEPGALSFFICVTALLRLYKNKNYKKTVLLMLLGLITLSVAHIIITSIIVLVCFFKYFKLRERIIFIVFCSITFLLMNYFFYDALNMFIYTRFRFSEVTGRFLGDTRTVQISELLEQLTIDKFLFGVDLKIQRSEELGQFGNIGENPFSPLFFNGIFISLEYYLMQGIFAISFLFISNKRWVYLSVLLLWMQRPYFNIIGYSIYLLVFFTLCLHDLLKSKDLKYFLRSAKNDE